ncbi:MAG TPA: thiamine-phosphate kinase [Candidatus Sulfotelmatobacter sp.]|nr:thiamine-phosphate kinase [Candidatus Sulfotelmatobacter sp.]
MAKKPVTAPNPDRHGGYSGRTIKSAIVQGIGDDCAVLKASAALDLLVTTDFSLEGIHFRRDWHSAESVGHRCLTRGLSDIASMGGSPTAAFLSLAVPRSLHQRWVAAFFRGLLKLANQYHVILAGGDTAESPDRILADIMVLGNVPKGRAILRSGARPGDRVFVSGELGGAATEIARLRSGLGRAVSARGYIRHFDPQPRIELGKALLRDRIATSMIDISDGLSTDLAHICEESRVGAEIIAASIPRARVGRPQREVGLELALHGGEDYELLFTVRGAKRVPRKLAGVVLTEIGRVTSGRGILLRDVNGKPRKLAPRGWEHFRK